MAIVYRTLLIFLALLLAACGGGDAEPDSTDSPPKPLCRIDPTAQCPFVPTSTP